MKLILPILTILLVLSAWYDVADDISSRQSSRDACQAALDAETAINGGYEIQCDELVHQ